MGLIELFIHLGHYLFLDWGFGQEYWSVMFQAVPRTYTETYPAALDLQNSSLGSINCSAPPVGRAPLQATPAPRVTLALEAQTPESL